MRRVWCYSDKELGRHHYCHHLDPTRDHFAKHMHARNNLWCEDLVNVVLTHVLNRINSKSSDTHLLKRL